jgi:hypothetical protein
MKSFKIYTENTNEKYIEELLNVSFDGFTIIHTTGFWKGQKEDSIIIEILTNNKTLIHAIAKQIKYINHQESILITETKQIGKFI